jgi:D-alanyl-D-alanine carboxypeptidase
MILASFPTAIVRFLAVVCAIVCLGAQAPAQAGGYSDMIIDMNSGKVLHETNADELRFPASLTKMMTLYVTFDMIEKKRLSLDTVLHISAQPSKLGLHEGDTIAVRDGIKALVTASANDVARTIAENLGTDEEKFATYMTWQAHKLGMKDTTFKNASGLPDAGQTTTARDYITLSQRLYDDFPQHFAFFKTPYFQWGRARYRNHNGLLFNFPGSDGIKTGYIRASGFNLAESVHRGGKHLIGVIFGGRSVGERNAKMRALLTAGLAKASTEKTRAPAMVASKGKAQQPAQVAAVAKPAPAPFAQKTVAAPAKTQQAAPAAAPDTAVADAAPAAVSATPLPGPFHIQIGAYPSEEEARQKLSVAMGLGKTVLLGHAAGAVTYNAPNHIWYRARFAGFDRSAADKTCLTLKAKKLDCIVMSAQ